MKTPRKSKTRSKRDTEGIARRLREKLEEIYGRLDDVGLASIARQRGYAVRTLQAHVNGKKPIGVETLMGYADEFDINLEFLITGRQPAGATPINTPQPPLAFRYVPLLTVMDIAGARTKEETLKARMTGRVLVPTDDSLGADIRAFEAPDGAMVAPVFDRNTCISEGEQAIIDARASFTPGSTVCAILFNPTRILLRVYGVARHPDGAGDITRLVPLNRLFAEEFIRSPADGFIFGVVDRVQAVRHFSRSKGQARTF